MVARTANRARLPCPQLQREHARPPGTLRPLQLLKGRVVSLMHALGFGQLSDLFRIGILGRSQRFRKACMLGERILRRPSRALGFLELGLRLRQAHVGALQLVATRLDVLDGSLGAGELRLRGGLLLLRRAQLRPGGFRLRLRAL